MTSILLSESVTKVFNALVSYIEKFSNFMTLEYLLYGSLGLMVLTLLITWIRTSFTYEAKLLSKTKKLNKYLAKKQNIDENNLIEFNDKMKQVPKVVRHNWQEYMLNRDKPSKYINCDNCIDIPTRISSYQTSIRICKIFISIICGLTFIFGLGNFYSITGRSAYAVFFQVLIVPVLLFVLGMLFISFLSARHTAIMADLYYNFQQFEKNLDRACKTMPEVIDYEVLFTKKEIKENIPALQEYLEKSEAAEKKRKEEEAMTNLVGENYDFEELGVDSSLLLERAMKESEKYLNVKRNFSERIRAKEQEKINYQKNFDEVTKDFERKAQASREIINSVSDQINQTTVKIEANYLKKKLNEEQARYQQYEKDYDLASSRFQKEQQDIQYEIDKFNDEIKRRKEQATENMLAEGNTYVNKIYGQVTETVLKQNQPLIDETQAKIDDLNEQINKLNATIQEKDNVIAEKEKAIEETKQELNVRLSELEAVKNLREYMTSEEFRQRLTMSKKELKQLKNQDREAFKYVKKEMKLPVEERLQDDSQSEEEQEKEANVTVVKLEDKVENNDADVKAKDETSNDNNANENGNVKVVKLPEENEVPEVKVVKLPEENVKEESKEESKEEAKEEKIDELKELTKDIEAENEKLREREQELSSQIDEVKPKNNANALKERMAKLNAQTKKAATKKATTSKTSTRASSSKVPTFTMPKIKK